MSMTELPLWMLFSTIAALTLASAYFSSSETAMMAINRYRLRHLLKQGHAGAERTSRLLSRPDRLLGVILIGNNLVNNFAATVAAVIGIQLFGDLGLALAPIVLTVVFLIFAEVAPKTIAADSPERLAFPSSLLLLPLLKLAYPFVVAVNYVSNAIARPFLHKHKDSDSDSLTIDELRTVVSEGVKLPQRRQDMMVSLLNLQDVTVNDIMVPRSEIIGIDIDDDLDEIFEQLSASQHTRMPVFRQNINDTIGLLHMRRLVRLNEEENITKADLLQLTDEPYYVPEATPLNRQLLNFQKERKRVALVVDEYGELQGLVTLEDLLEEIVGEFTTDLQLHMPELYPQEDGSHVMDGSVLLRDVNRALRWALPTDGPKTVNGLILETLEFIPDSALSVPLPGYRIEVLQIKDNSVKSARIWQVEIEPLEPLETVAPAR